MGFKSTTLTSELKTKILNGFFDGKPPRKVDKVKGEDKITNSNEPSPTTVVVDSKTHLNVTNNEKENTMTTDNTNSNPTANPVTLETTKKRGRPSKLSASAAELTSLYNSGVSAKTLAEKYSVSVSCVLNTLRSNGITIRAKGRTRKPQA